MGKKKRTKHRIKNVRKRLEKNEARLRAKLNLPPKEKAVYQVFNLGVSLFFFHCWKRDRDRTFLFSLLPVVGGKTVGKRCLFGVRLDWHPYYSTYRITFQGLFFKVFGFNLKRRKTGPRKDETKKA